MNIEENSSVYIDVEELRSLFNLVQKYYEKLTGVFTFDQEQIKEYFKDLFNLEEVSEDFLLKVARALEFNKGDITKDHLVGIGYGPL